jgi:hypothetical protein
MDAALFSCGVPPFDSPLNRCFKYQKEAIMANAIWKKDGGQGFRFQVSGFRFLVSGFRFWWFGFRFYVDSGFFSWYRF